MKNVKEFIEKVAPMSDADFELLSSKAIKAKFKKGSLLIKEGQVCNRLLYIERGLFRYYLLHKGCDYTKDFALETQNPFCTAYTSLMLQKPSEIWIEALENSEVWSWNKEDVLPLFHDHPAWLRFAKAMVDRMYFRKERREIAFLKCSPSERYKQFRTEFPELLQRVSQYHVATYLGITPESLSRIRKRISREA